MSEVEVRKYEIGAKHRKNLKKLADYLAALPPDYKHFNMRTYVSGGLDPDDLTRDYLKGCGTVACAAGHAPAAGIGRRSLGRYRDWQEYLEYFLLPVGAPYTELFQWMFDATWSFTDDTPQGAAKRIYFVLEHGGIPVNTWDQLSGKAPYMFADAK
jgi:hypothetical protein